MPKPTKGTRLGGSPTHQRMILRNLATQLFEHGRIKTTVTKARRVQPVAEQLITKAKRGDLASLRLVKKSITDPYVVHELFTEIAPSFADRDGGYTRITKVGPRKGDNAPMAVIELVTETVEDSRANRSKSPRAAQAAPTAPAKATETEEVVEPEDSLDAEEPEAEDSQADEAAEAQPAEEAAEAEEAPAAEADEDASDDK